MGDKWSLEEWQKTVSEAVYRERLFTLACEQLEDNEDDLASAREEGDEKLAQRVERDVRELRDNVDRLSKDRRVFYAYVWRDGAGEPIYVGKGVGDRAFAHKQRPEWTRRPQPITVELHVCSCEEEAKSTERAIYDTLIENGAVLANRVRPGGGLRPPRAVPGLLDAPKVVPASSRIPVPGPTPLERAPGWWTTMSAGEKAFCNLHDALVYAKLSGTAVDGTEFDLGACIAKYIEALPLIAYCSDEHLQELLTAWRFACAGATRSEMDRARREQAREAKQYGTLNEDGSMRVSQATYIRCVVTDWCEEQDRLEAEAEDMKEAA